MERGSGFDKARKRVGKQVREVRKARNETPAQFGQHFGRSARTVEDWEQGRRLLDVPCQAILDRLEADLTDIRESRIIRA